MIDRQTGRRAQEGAVGGRSGRKDFEGSELALEWTSADDGLAVAGRVWMRGSSQEARFRLDAAEPRYRLEFLPRGVAPRGHLSLHLGRAYAHFGGDIQLRADLVFEGLLAEWPLAPGPAVPDGSDAGVVIDNALPCDVHPFVLTRPCALLTEAPPEDFVACADPGALALYQALAPLRAGTDGGAAMRAAAATFAGSPAFVTSLAALPAPMPAFPGLWRALWDLPGDVERQPLLELVAAALGEELSAFLQSSVAATAYADLWQTLYASALLAATWPPAPAPDVASLALGVRLFGLLRGLDAGLPGPLAAAKRRAALAARPVVPDEVTPPPPPAGAAGWADLAGAGQLYVLQERLAGYVAPEIGLTVNVMPGERRVVVERHRTEERVDEASRVDALDRDHAREQASGDSVLSDAVTDLVAAKSICRNYDDTKTYGADGLSFSFKGTDNGTDCPQSRDAHLATEIAEHVTRSAVRLVEERTVETRRRRVRDERDHLRRSDVDNRTSETRRVGVYRWIRKLLEMSLRRRGPRLMVEILVPTPAASYLAFVDGDAGPPLVAPVPPPVTSPTDVTADNYLALAAQYDATGVTAPPAQTRVFTAAYRGQGAPVADVLVVPPGYAAGKAVVSAVVRDQTRPLAGVVGDWAFVLSHASTAALVGAALRRLTVASDGDCPPCPDPFQSTPPTPATLTGQSTLPVDPAGPTTGELPVSFLGSDGGWFASVAVQATLSSYAQDQAAWQIATYDAIQSGYARQLTAYRDARARRVAETSKDRHREIEVRELSRSGLDVLWERHAGAPDEPAYLRYFRRALDWKDMAYEFYPWPVGAPPRAPDACWAGEALLDPRSDELFRSFLTAQSARVLVPAAPGCSASLVFYFVWGVLPPWAEADAPAPASLVPVLAASAGGWAPDEPPERWTVEVPTAHLFLQEGPDLQPAHTPPRGGFRGLP